MTYVLIMVAVMAVVWLAVRRRPAPGPKCLKCGSRLEAGELRCRAGTYLVRHCPVCDADLKKGGE